LKSVSVERGRACRGNGIAGLEGLAPSGERFEGYALSASIVSSAAGWNGNALVSLRTEGLGRGALDHDNASILIGAGNIPGGALDTAVRA
jgi:hypothetical protein